MQMVGGGGANRWRCCLRHCATTRKVAGSIPDGVIGIFSCHNPSCRTLDVESTQPLREMEVKRSLGRANNHIIFMCRLSWNVGASTSWNSQGLSWAAQGMLYLHLLWESCKELQKHYEINWYIEVTQRFVANNVFTSGWKRSKRRENFPVNAIKVYRGSRSTGPLILNLGTRWRWALTVGCSVIDKPDNLYIKLDPVRSRV